MIEVKKEKLTRPERQIWAWFMIFTFMSSAALPCQWHWSQVSF